jgi:hypothetical protein
MSMAFGDPRLKLLPKIKAQTDQSNATAMMDDPSASASAVHAPPALNVLHTLSSASNSGAGGSPSFVHPMMSLQNAPLDDEDVEENDLAFSSDDDSGSEADSESESGDGSDDEASGDEDSASASAAAAPKKKRRTKAEMTLMRASQPKREAHPRAARAKGSEETAKTAKRERRFKAGNHPEVIEPVEVEGYHAAVAAINDPALKTFMSSAKVKLGDSVTQDMLAAGDSGAYYDAAVARSSERKKRASVSGSKMSTGGKRKKGKPGKIARDHRIAEGYQKPILGHIIQNGLKTKEQVAQLKRYVDATHGPTPAGKERAARNFKAIATAAMTAAPVADRVRHAEAAMNDMRSGTGNLRFGDSGYNTGVGRAADFNMTPRGTNYTPRTYAHVDSLVSLAELGALPPAIVAQAVIPPRLRSTGKPVSTADPASTAQYYQDLHAAQSASPTTKMTMPRAPRKIALSQVNLNALRRPPQAPVSRVAHVAGPPLPPPETNPNTILSFMRQQNS